MTSNERERHDPAAEPTTVLPQTAAELVELERLQQALAESEERAKGHWEQYLRAVAELDNVRKRAQRDIESANRYGLEKLRRRSCLPVRTAWSWRSQNAGAADAREPRVRAGGDARSCCSKALEKFGVTADRPAGEPFDPARHEAMMTQESDDRRAELGAAGDPAGLRAERPAAATGPGHRGKAALRGP